MRNPLLFSSELLVKRALEDYNAPYKDMLNSKNISGVQDFWKNLQSYPQDVQKKIYEQMGQIEVPGNTYGGFGNMLRHGASQLWHSVADPLGEWGNSIAQVWGGGRTDLSPDQAGNDIIGERRDEAKRVYDLAMKDPQYMARLKAAIPQYEKTVKTDAAKLRANQATPTVTAPANNTYSGSANPAIGSGGPGMFNTSNIIRQTAAPATPAVAPKAPTPAPVAATSTPAPTQTQTPAQAPTPPAPAPTSPPQAAAPQAAAPQAAPVQAAAPVKAQPTSPVPPAAPAPIQVPATPTLVSAPAANPGMQSQPAAPAKPVGGTMRGKSLADELKAMRARQDQGVFGNNESPVKANPAQLAGLNTQRNPYAGNYSYPAMSRSIDGGKTFQRPGEQNPASQQFNNYVNRESNLAAQQKANRNAAAIARGKARVEELEAKDPNFFVGSDGPEYKADLLAGKNI